MNYKITEKLFEKNGITDNKHILNTSEITVDESVLNEIEKGGVTLERLNELNKSGLDIYKYQTQITIHGLFPELGVNYLYGYKLLFQNKNKSIGVKWMAIDAAKKERIYSALSYYGWGCVKNSTSWYVYKMKAVTNKEQAAEWAAKFHNETKNLNTNLFFGNAGIYMAKSMFGVYVVSEININGIYEKNVTQVIEQVAGKRISEIETEIERIKLEREEKRKIEHEEFEKEREMQEEKERQMAAELLANGIPEGYKFYESLDIVDGLETAYVYAFYHNDKAEWRFNKYTKRPRQIKFRKNGIETYAKTLRNIYAKLPN